MKATTSSLISLVHKTTASSTMYCLVGIGIALQALSAGAAIPQSERDALIALYTSTNGTGWLSHDGWRNAEDTAFNDPGTECTWFGVSCFSDQTSVSGLLLGSNQLSGSLPQEIGNLTGLEYLDLSMNQLSGSIPTAISTLTHLQSLYLWRNQLSGPIPPEIGSLTGLQYMSLSGNELTGIIPDEIEHLVNLEQLYLNGNQLIGPVPAWLGSLVNLRLLDLSSNQLDGQIPPAIGDLRSLEVLDLGENQLTGPLPPALSNLENLTNLALNQNLLIGPLPAWIGDLTSLQVLWLNNNQLSGPLPPELGNLTSLQGLFLWSNELSGPLPSEMRKLTSLEVMHLSGNQFTGQLPAWIGELTKLRGLYLGQSRFTGPLPTTLNNLTYLTDLILPNNSLSGQLPAWIGDLTNLRNLVLWDNRMDGPVPTEIGNLSNLVRMNLGCNRFTGALPQTLTNLTNLEDGELELRWNGLYSDDSTLVAFLNTKQSTGDWQGTQTIAPEGVSVTAIGDHSVWLSWSPILYTADDGGYEVLVRQLPGGLLTSAGYTADKTTTVFPVTGLQPGLSYELSVRTFTNPHGSNQNTVVSEPSPLVTVTTSSSGCTPPQISASSLCSPATLTLTSAHDSFEWSTGETTQSITVNPPSSAWYWVSTIGPGGCAETASVYVDECSGAALGGRISDAVTGMPVEGAEISVYNLDTGEWTVIGSSNEAGEYGVEPILPEGDYVAVATHQGYLSQLWDGVSCTPACDPMAGTAFSLIAGTTEVIDFALERDTDADLIPDAADNCITTANSSQADHDGDGIGDACAVVGMLALGGDQSVATAISDSGYIVGWSKDASGEDRAFLTVIGKKTEDLGTLGGSWSRAYDVADDGSVVGESETADGSTHAFLWQRRTMYDLGTLGPAYEASGARGLNEHGEIVGWSSPLTGERRAVLWGGEVLDLGDLGQGWSEAAAINNLGLVVGHSSAASAVTQGFVWDDGVLYGLGSFLMSTNYPWAVDQHGRIVGQATSDADHRAFLLTPEDSDADGAPDRWYRDDDGNGTNDLVQDLGTLGGNSALAWSISGTGRIVGGANPIPGSERMHAFLRPPSGWLVDLGTLGGDDGQAFDVNNRDQMVGRSTPFAGLSRGFLAVLGPLPIPEGTDVLARLRELDATRPTATVEVTFDQVLDRGGKLSLSTTELAPLPPPGFRFGEPPTVFHLDSTASFDVATVCIDYGSLSYLDESTLVLAHYEDSDGDGEPDAWVDRTESLDQVNHRICGSVDSFSSFAVFEEDVPEQTIALTLTADTSVHSLSPDTNAGGAEVLVTGDFNRARALVKVDSKIILNAVGSWELVAAKLELSLDTTKASSPAKAQIGVSVSQLVTDWAEGDGLAAFGKGVILPRHIGATWHCAVDEDITNQTQDCLETWNMAGSAGLPLPWASQPTDAEPVLLDNPPRVQWDVTADVLAFLAREPNFGWVLLTAKKAPALTFSSREGDSPGQLMLTIRE